MLLVLYLCSLLQGIEIPKIELVKQTGTASTYGWEEPLYHTTYCGYDTDEFVRSDSFYGVALPETTKEMCGELVLVEYGDKQIDLCSRGFDMGNNL